MNQALEIQAFSETTGGCWAKWSAPSTQTRENDPRDSASKASDPDLFPDSQRAQDNNNRANSIGSVGMYHPTDVSPNSLKLMDNGTRANTTPM